MVLPPRALPWADLLCPFGAENWVDRKVRCDCRLRLSRAEKWRCPTRVRMEKHEPLRRHHHRRRAQRSRHRGVLGACRPARARARTARTCGRHVCDGGALARLPGFDGSVREQPLPPRDHPGPGPEAPRLRDAAAQSLELHALSRRSLPADGAGQGADPPGNRQVLAEGRRVAAEVRGDAGAGGRLP